MLYVYGMILPETIDNKIFHYWNGIISEERRSRIAALYNKEDKLRTLFAEILLRYVLQKVFYVHQEEIKFNYNQYGKPKLECMNNIEFNLSHSEKWVLCGIGDAEIGIDVERIGEFKMNIAKRFYSKKECKDLSLIGNDERKRQFYSYWSLKESYVKAIGKGLSIPLNTLEFHIGAEDISLYVNEKLNKENYFKLLKIDPMYSSAICWKGDKGELMQTEIQIVELEQLLSWKILN